MACAPTRQGTCRPPSGGKYPRVASRRRASSPLRFAPPLLRGFPPPLVPAAQKPLCPVPPAQKQHTRGPNDPQPCSRLVSSFPWICSFCLGYSSSPPNFLRFL